MPGISRSVSIPAPARPSLPYALAAACHPGPTLAVTALVTALVAGSGRSPAACAGVALAVLAGQLSVGWCNDAVDAARDAATGQRGKPIPAGLVSVRTVGVAAGVALLLCVPLSLLSGPVAAAVHLGAVALAWAYNLGVKATVLSWAPYTVAFGLVPVFVAAGLPGGVRPAWWAVSAAALLGLGAHLANVLPDIDADLSTGVRSLPQRLGARRVRLLAPVPLLLAVALLVVGPAGDPGIPGWTALAAATTLTAASWTLGARRPRVPFVTAIAVAAVGVVLLLVRGAGV
ncbi:membrane protein [Acrocarpospora phusangensis]|uniref:Membrane protein n=1 Tax=Acrocarpospora phusangensis TaxID=1070424 RepID=A0A919Q9K3_9ACTN|nr:UbiA family prenyltransferase [Acrocarpospora phusangensis]GIH24731.1 membrane protein [Acrocarpospora phusangensis]